MLFEKLKVDYLQARKDKNTPVINVLSTMIGDLEKGLKMGDDGKKIPSPDATVISLFKAEIKTIDDKVLPHVEEHTTAWDEVMKERQILESYLPKQLDENEILTAILLAMNLGATDVGGINKFLKSQHEGRYDGKVANQLIQKVLKGE